MVACSAASLVSCIKRQLKLMGKLLDALEDNDDVQNVWHILENEEDLPE